ncbi:MAG: hypothetical protein DWQ46_13615 [Planctomycetota bacterium]|nr:MAG: hypothetical protein DWQ46_13615 [Planctomycetota bacterium]
MPGALQVHVTRKSLGRALRIVDTFIKSWECLGGTVSLEGTHREGERNTIVAIGPDGTAVELFEETKVIAKQREGLRHISIYDRQYRPTGNLVFQIHGYGDGHRRRWADGKRQRLENMLHRIVKGLADYLDYEKYRRLDDECEERQEARVQKIRSARERREQLAEERRVDLLKRASDWHKSTQLRAYLKALSEKIADDALTAENPDLFSEWYEWAMWYADSIDPLTPTPSRPEYTEELENTLVEELDLTRRTKPVVDQLGVKDTDALYKIDKAAVSDVCGGDAWHPWREICRVLEGLGYDVSDRQSSWY